uniref:Putative exported fimbrial protein n=1 Tax=Yersinia enterocolitica TaxID=630 RepID=F2Q827_YEREN|nr:putative exported fimbrial protein [Yersinia enterocolitica]
MLNRRSVARLVIVLATGLLVNSSVVLAAEQVTLQVKLTILAPTCTINDNKAMSVDFGEVLTEKVNGNNYIKPVEYSLKCTGSDSQMFNMTIQGTQAPFNDSALKTNITDFGIALLANDTPLKINDSIAFRPAKKPVLQVVPIKVANTRLKGGNFTANAVMKISYQ